MPRIKIKNSFSHKLLKALAISGAVLIAGTSPYFGLGLIRGIKSELERKKWREFYIALSKLKRQKRINVNQNQDGSYTVEITNLGTKVIEKHELDSLIIKKPVKWDGLWRFISFDIPAKKKWTRQVLLAKLKELNFIMVQKSLWAHPYECYFELAVICKAFAIERFVYIFTVSNCNNERILRRKFQQKDGTRLAFDF